MNRTQPGSDITPDGPLTRAIPGLHIVANLSVLLPGPTLREFQAFRTFIDQQIAALMLTKVGEAYHDFPGGGFTGVVCLTESHLSIHTWPEQGYLTFDVFLSNHLKDNRPATRALYAAVRTFFNGTPLLEQYIDR